MNRIGSINETLITNTLTSTFLNVHSCGYHELENEDHNINKPEGRGDYQLIYIVKGHGNFTLKETETTLTSGSMIVYPPNTAQLYHFSSDEATVYYSLSFIGGHNHLELEPLFDKGPFVVTIGYQEAICSAFETMITEITSQKDHYLQICNYTLYNVLLRLLRYVSPTENPRYPFEQVMQKTAEYMRKNYAKKYTVQDYATYSNLSPSRFNHNFEAVFSTTPMRFITKIRLEHACWLLMNTQMPIAAIGSAVGYDDPLYFSRVFKKEHGFSPRSYRNNLLP